MCYSLTRTEIPHFIDALLNDFEKERIAYRLQVFEQLVNEMTLKEMREKNGTHGDRTNKIKHMYKKLTYEQLKIFHKLFKK
jgi:hypothetical protein